MAIATARDFEVSNSEFLSITQASQSGLDPGDADFYMCTWVKMESFPALNAIMCKWTNNGGAGTCSYNLIYTSSRFYMQVSSTGVYNSGVGTVIANNFGAASLATWYFVECYHDSVNNLIGICVNRGTDNTTAHSTGVYSGASAQFCIGAFSAGGGFQYDGLQSSAVFISGIPTSGERDAIYNSGAGVLYGCGPTLSSASYVSWWNLDEASGNALDSVGSNTLTDNNTVLSAAGLIEECSAGGSTKGGLCLLGVGL